MLCASVTYLNVPLCLFEHAYVPVRTESTLSFLRRKDKKVGQIKITSDMVKKLRETSGVGVMSCKKALANTGGDLEKALEFLREKGVSLAAKKAGRETTEGLISSYIHFGGKIGVLVEFNCETDFVAKTDEFKQLAKDISMHIAWSNPRFMSRDEVPKEIVEQAKDREKYFSQACLLDQSFLKDNEISINDYLSSAITKIGENIRIRRFVRYQLGEE